MTSFAGISLTHTTRFHAHCQTAGEGGDVVAAANPLNHLQLDPAGASDISTRIARYTMAFD